MGAGSGAGGWWVAVTTVAAAVVVVTLAVGVLTAPPSGSLETRLERPSGLGDMAETALDSMGLDGARVLGLRDELVAAFERRRDDLPVDAAASVDESLAELDRTIGELSAALERDPSNPELARLLASAYRRQVEMLRRVERLAPKRAVAPVAPVPPRATGEK